MELKGHAKPGGVARLDAHRTLLPYSGLTGLAMATGWTVAAIYFVREVGTGPLELVLAPALWLYARAIRLTPDEAYAVTAGETYVRKDAAWCTLRPFTRRRGLGRTSARGYLR